MLVGGNGKQYFQGGAIADLRIFTRPISVEEGQLASLWLMMESAREKQPDQWSAAERDAFHLYFLTHEDAQVSRAGCPAQSVESRET